MQTPACLELSVDEVAELIARKSAMVVDVNPRRRWASGHLPGAVNLDPGEFSGADLPADKQTTLVFYCSEPDSRSSRYAARKAAKLGHVNVFIMPAGIRGWLAARRPAEAV